ncbi:MAG: diguanylate cyclase [Solirubrobacteraceae bacterium]|nr:diguanylate cyclase [Solirubrobacteraceae bacterium]
MSHPHSLALVLQESEHTRDVFTGALAPSAFRKAVQTWTDEGARRQLPSSTLLLVEVDWFTRPKRSEMATVLRIVSDIIRPRLRSSDVLGRIDDHTLGILLPTTPTLHAQRVGRRVVAAVSSRTPATGHPVTVSVGMASALGARPWEAAAQALADARNEGGDRTVCALEPRIEDENELAA